MDEASSPLAKTNRAGYVGDVFQAQLFPTVPWEQQSSLCMGIISIGFFLLEFEIMIGFLTTIISVRGAGCPNCENRLSMAER